MSEEKGLIMKYFVLSPGSKDYRHAKASREAMRAYANEIESTDSKRAQDIRKWADKEEKEHLDSLGDGYHQVTEDPEKCKAELGDQI